MIASCHVDDTLVAGTKEAIAEFKAELSERFKLKELGIMTKHLGIKYDWRTDESGETYVVATMDDLITEIIKVTGMSASEFLSLHPELRTSSRAQMLPPGFRLHLPEKARMSIESKFRIARADGERKAL